MLSRKGQRRDLRPCSPCGDLSAAPSPQRSAPGTARSAQGARSRAPPVRARASGGLPALFRARATRSGRRSREPRKREPRAVGASRSGQRREQVVDADHAPPAGRVPRRHAAPDQPGASSKEPTARRLGRLPRPLALGPHRWDAIRPEHAAPSRSRCPDRVGSEIKLADATGAAAREARERYRRSTPRRAGRAHALSTEAAAMLAATTMSEIPGTPKAAEGDVWMERAEPATDERERMDARLPPGPAGPGGPSSGLVAPSSTSTTTALE